MEKYIFISLLVSVLLLSCTRTQQTLTTTHIGYDWQKSALATHDTLYVHDSVLVYVHGDTIYRDRVRMQYRVVYVDKEQTKEKTDTIVSLEERTITDKRPMIRYRLLLICLIMVVVAVIGVRIWLRLRN